MSESYRKMPDENLSNSFNKPSRQEIHAFVAAARKGDQPAVIKFLDRFATAIDLPDDFNNTALMEAASRGQKEMAQLLLARGADVNAQTRHGWTALFRIAGGKDTEMARLLLQNGASLEIKTMNDYTPLMLAKKSKAAEMTAFFLQWPEMERQRIAAEKVKELEADIRDFSAKLKRSMPASRPLKAQKRKP